MDVHIGTRLAHAASVPGANEYYALSIMSVFSMVSSERMSSGSRGTRSITEIGAKGAPHPRTPNTDGRKEGRGGHAWGRSLDNLVCVEHSRDAVNDDAAYLCGFMWDRQEARSAGSGAVGRRYIGRRSRNGSNWKGGINALRVPTDASSGTGAGAAVFRRGGLLSGEVERRVVASDSDKSSVKQIALL